MKRSLRWFVLDRDSYTCQYCGRQAPEVILEVDHIWAKSQGGADHVSNLITACWDCNQGKKANDSTDGLTGKDWIASLKAELKEVEGYARHLEEERPYKMLRYLITTYATEHAMDDGDVLDWLMSEVAA